MGVIGACLVMAGVASGAYWYGTTPQAAALATTKNYAAHEVKAWNQPQVRTPSGPAACYIALRGSPTCAGLSCTRPLYCHGLVTVGVKRLAPHRFRGQELSGKYLDAHGC